MILSDKQAHLLLQLLQDTLTKNVIGYLTTTPEDRCNLLNEIINQQSRELIKVGKEETF